jgi:hypothetical protein
MHREDGTVSVRVTFEAVLQLEPDDPLLASRKKAQATSAKLHKETMARNAHISEYIIAKQVGEYTLII